MYHGQDMVVDIVVPRARHVVDTFYIVKLLGFSTVYLLNSYTLVIIHDRRHLGNVYTVHDTIQLLWSRHSIYVNKSKILINYKF